MLRSFFNAKVSLILLSTPLVFSTMGCAQDRSTSSTRSESRWSREIDGRSIEYIRNSETAGQAIAINSSGSILGFKEVPNPDMTIFAQVFFHDGPDGTKEMPIPDGFTNVDGLGLSDNEQVIGRATRPIGHKDGSIHAVLWTPKSDAMIQLPPPAECTMSDAHAINASGTRIVGTGTGEGRMVPVVWDLDAQTGDWTPTTLPTLMPYNPYLMASRLVISPDGTFIAGCCAESVSENGTIDSSLFGWTTVEGEWERSKLNDEQLYLRGVNNQREIVGSVLAVDGRHPAIVTTAGDVQRLKLIDDNTTGEALSINADSQIVGWCDNTFKEDGGPVPCLWKNDGSGIHLRLSETGFGMAFGINDRNQIAGCADALLDGVTDPTSPDAASLLLPLRATPTSSRIPTP